MENKEKLLLQQKKEQLVLDGVNLQDFINLDRHNKRLFFKLLHHKFINEKKVDIIINQCTQFDGYSIDETNDLYVPDDKFESLKKEIYLFAEMACGKMGVQRDSIMPFSDIYQMLNYSDYLMSNGERHCINIVEGVDKPMINMNTTYTRVNPEYLYQDYQQKTKVKV